MKNIFTLLFLLAVSTGLYAQQEEQFTQFMYNKAILNPAYAGSLGGYALSGTFRKQWANIEGSPLSQNLSFHTPLSNDKIGLGLNLSYNTVGITDKWTASGLYSYRVALKNGATVSLGINASIRYLYNNYSDGRLTATNPIETDGSIPTVDRGRYVPNFGLGIYYQNENAYFGISSPRLLQSNIDFSDSEEIGGKEVLHSYIMGGMQFPVAEGLIFYPQLLLKIASNTPFDADIHAGFIVQDNIHLGATYRLGGDAASVGESIDLVVGYSINPNILLGASYDFTLSKISKYSKGTFELSLRYLIDNSSSKAKEKDDKDLKGKKSKKKSSSASSRFF